MYLPSWAVSVFGVVFFAVAALASWAMRHAGRQVQIDVRGVKESVEKIDDKVGVIDRRLVRVETLLNGTMHTPPLGVPIQTPPTGTPLPDR